MKKSILLLLLSVCFLTGCTKHYNSVLEYSADMEKVRNKIGDYTIEATMTGNNVNNYYKSVIKGEKWRVEESRDNGNTYNSVLLYDGKKIYAYSKNENYAIEMPIKELLKQSGIDNEKTELIMKVINPVGILVHWNLDEISGSIDNAWDFGPNDRKNNFDCRMMTYKLESGYEACVSDKYGIAVYAKVNTKKQGLVEINAKKIDNTPVSEQEVELPSGMKVVSMYDLFKSMFKYKR